MLGTAILSSDLHASVWVLWIQRKSVSGDRIETRNDCTVICCVGQVRDGAKNEWEVNRSREEQLQH
jgi:hypothetical protein